MATGLTPKSSEAQSTQMRFGEGSVHMPQENSVLKQSDSQSEEDGSDKVNRQLQDEKFRRQ